MKTLFLTLLNVQRRAYFKNIGKDKARIARELKK